MAEETVLYDVDTKRFCTLNPTAAYLWEMLARPSTEDELSRAMRERFSVDLSATVERDVREAMGQLRDLALIEAADEDSA